MSKQTDLINIPDAITVDGSNNVGIGTDSPTGQLHIKGDADMGIRVESAAGGYSAIGFGDSVDTVRGGITYYSTDNSLQFRGYNNTERMRIDSSGNVGIGTTNPTVAAGTGLVINGGTNQARLALKNDATGDGSGDGFQIVVTSGSGSNGGQAIFEQRENNIIAFKTNSSETMRIDSSGRLLVGKTAVDNTSVGFRFDGSSGFASFVRDGGEPLYLNRKTSDGEILKFAKDGTTVGSIGTIANYMTVGTSDSGILFHSGEDNIQPWNVSTNAGRDNAISLGASNGRFKDAYLSGGVYLGGTGSANKLDDYEEGTFTPYVRINNGVEGIVVSHAAGTYTKIGRLVSVSLRWRTTSKGSNAGGVELDGLPFTVANLLGTTSIENSGSIAYVGGISGTWYDLTAFAVESQTRIGFYVRDSTSGVPVGLVNTKIDNIFDGRISLVYYTT